MKVIVPLGRVLFSLIFILSGFNHFSTETIQYAASTGLPMPSFLVPFSGVMAVLGGLAIALGYHARIGAWLIVLFLIPVTFTMHNFWAIDDQMMRSIQQTMFMKNLSMLGGALLITHFGSGPVSFDSRRRQAQ